MTPEKTPIQKLAADILAAPDALEVEMILFAFESEYHTQSFMDREWELSAIANNQRESAQTITDLRHLVAVNGW